MPEVPPPRYHTELVFEHNVEFLPRNLEQAEGQSQPQHADSALLSTTNRTIQFPKDFVRRSDNLLGEMSSPVHHGKNIVYLGGLRSPLFNGPVYLPPEVLGHIFWCRVVSGVNSSGSISRGTYNFLLVCRHWFDVATSTPSLWAFWGTSLREFLTFHRHSGDVPLYINLTNINSDRVTDASYILQDWSVQRRICDLHIRTSPGALTNILSLMSMPRPSLVRSRIKSLKFIAEEQRNAGLPEELPDITNFLKAYSLPELRSLVLHNCRLMWESLIYQSSGLTRIDIRAHNGCTKPTILQLATLFAVNIRLEEIHLSLDIASMPKNFLSELPTSIVLPHLRRLIIRRGVSDHIRLLNRLAFSNLLKQVDIGLYLDRTIADVPKALAPCMRKVFLECRSSKLVAHIIYSRGGMDIKVSWPGEGGDFLMLRTSTLGTNFWNVAPSTLTEDLVGGLPTAKITSLTITGSSNQLQQDFLRLFQMFSAVQELRIVNSQAARSIIDVLGYPSATADEEETVLLPHLRTFRLKSIDLVSLEPALCLEGLLKRRHRAGIPLSILSIERCACPAINSDVCSRLEELLSDHFCWDHNTSVAGDQRACEVCHIGFSDSDEL